MTGLARSLLASLAGYLGFWLLAWRDRIEANTPCACGNGEPGMCPVCHTRCNGACKACCDTELGG